MKKLTTLLMAIMTVFAAEAQSVNIYNLSTGKSTIDWKASKLTGSSHTGTVMLNSGVLTEENGQLTGGQMVIDMTSIACTDLENSGMNLKLVNHLKSEDFFSVEMNPTATIKINSITKSKEVSKGTHLVKGDLTIKGIKNPIEFFATINKVGNGYTAIANIIVDRSQYNVQYGSDSFFKNLGDKAISNNIEFRVKLYTNQ